MKSALAEAAGSLIAGFDIGHASPVLLRKMIPTLNPGGRIYGSQSMTQGGKFIRRIRSSKHEVERRLSKQGSTFSNSIHAACWW
jgi:hypothetical protein